MNRSFIGGLIVGLLVFGSIAYVGFTTLSFPNTSSALNSYTGNLEGESGPTYDESISSSEEDFYDTVDRLEEEISILEDEKYGLENEVTRLEEEIGNIRHSITSLADDAALEYYSMEELINELYVLVY